MHVFVELDGQKRRISKGVLDIWIFLMYEFHILRIIFISGNFIFIFKVIYSTLIHLSLLRFYCVILHIIRQTSLSQEPKNSNLLHYF
jgi:hypothetical protein